MSCITNLNCQTCQIIQHLTQENTALKTQIDSLKRSLMRYENPHTPSSKRMYPTRTGDHTKSTKRFPGRPKGHKGTTRPKPKQIDITKAPEHKCTCTHCGTPLNEPTHVGHHIFEEIANPKPKQVIDYLQFEYKCKACKGYTFARHPDCPPEGIFGKNALIQATLMKFEERLPFEKIAKQMECQHGLPMTAASAYDVTRRVCDYLAPEYDTILGRIRMAKVLYIDETGEKVDGKRQWLWVFVSESETFFVLRKSRGKKG